MSERFVRVGGRLTAFTERGGGAMQVSEFTLLTGEGGPTGGSLTIKRGHANELQPMGKEEPVPEHVA
jgi:hypothetical protein